MSATPKTKKCGDLIYDAGMHKGEDTDYYLKKGSRVIGFEANPTLVEERRSKFADEFKNGKLIIVEGAITEYDSRGTRGRTTTCYTNKCRSVSGTVSNEWASRNEALGRRIEIKDVPIIDFSQCLKKYGIPHYVKIDIEGMDTVCLKALLGFEQKPDYLSIESEKASFTKLIEELSLLVRRGYTEFKTINQQCVSSQVEPNPSREGCCTGYQFK